MALLRELLTEIEYACVRGTLDREVTDIIYDSRQHRHIRLCRKLHLLLHKQYPRTGFHRRRREPVRKIKESLKEK